MLHKGKSLTSFRADERFGEVVLRLGEAVYTMSPAEAKYLAVRLREAIHKATDYNREIVCIGCLRPLDEEDVIWYDPARRVLSTDTGSPYCVGCCPED